MARADSWRGSPEVTRKTEFAHLVDHLRPSPKKDVFFDLGCGYGNLCVWIADRVERAVGFETYFPRYRRARQRVEKSGKSNVTILRRNFDRVSFKDATIIFSTLGIVWKTLERIQSECKKGTRLILCYEPYPIKAKKFEDYYIVKVPFSRFNDETEFARICFNVGSIRQVYRKMNDRTTIHLLKWDISHAESNWRRINQN